MKIIIKSILEKISKDHPEAYVDLFLGQFQAIDQGAGIPMYYPAALIEITGITWAAAAGGVQHGQGTLRLHLGQQNYALSDQYSPSQETALGLYDTLERFHLTLQGFTPPGCSSLQRTFSGYAGELSNTMVFTIDYAFSIQDSCAAGGGYQQTPAPAPIPKQVSFK